MPKKQTKHRRKGIGTIRPDTLLMLFNGIYNKDVENTEEKKANDATRSKKEKMQEKNKEIPVEYPKGKMKYGKIAWEKYFTTALKYKLLFGRKPFVIKEHNSNDEE